jgi:hypothetical protein
MDGCMCDAASCQSASLGMIRLATVPTCRAALFAA